MYDNVIWIDKEWWIGAWICIATVVMIFTKRNQNIGLADRFAVGIGSGVMALVFIALAMAVLSFFGVELGMRG